jgi:tetrahydromethanopterin S-methyltransferase subunit G
MSDSRFDFLSSIEGWIVGFFTAVATIFGWFNGKINGVHKRLDDVEKETAMNKANLMVQDAHHQANIQRLDRIERETVKQTDMLTELMRCRTHTE